MVPQARAVGFVSTHLYSKLCVVLCRCHGLRGRFGIRNVNPPALFVFRYYFVDYSESLEFPHEFYDQLRFCEEPAGVG